jgi:3-deoxy-D-manno-octulosonate 8-phosphate phosphatase (KDO 8-P phosphatase)
MDNGSCPVGPKGYSDCNLTQALRERAMERNKPVPRSQAWKSVLVKARKVELLLLDVDGVLTDGTIIYTHDGGESKGFNTRDGFGLRMLQDVGVAVGVITARTSEAVSRRAADLGFAHVYQGQKDKAAVYREILAQTGLDRNQTAYMGDDLMDLPLLTRVGCSFAPADGVAEVRRCVDYTTEQGGGHGAVREVCDLLLEARGELAPIVARYTR